MELFNEEYVYQLYLDQEDIARIDKQLDGMEAETYDEIFHWCDQTIGRNMWDNDWSDLLNCDIMKFKTEEHRTMFVLKWS